MLQFLFYYFLVINIFTFVVFVIDKRRAIYNERRLPEKILWLLAILGGSLGGLIAMELIKHKNRKMGFVLVMLGIILAQMMIIYLALKYL
ncbi:hypothetical protein A2V95_03650 [Candidatus Kuenenbacteria bacterium RBG_16_41_7]|uniref:Cold-shock protein n=1 Tax=Candidatus Kuenenbacteria bacterium RBG_16_41_7 TaxID=1798560 RepID=A0A1F6GC98_9BACT|nr:MAG: hypothetical protein A2V95_03650 [Candidatus Kuenenbacteria bacterium RBG_16_41_7]